MDLEVADFSRSGGGRLWQIPEPFTVKADDGVTDLYGVMYKPFDFDSTKVYPIIEYVYPGPQTEAVAKSFNQGNNLASRYEIGISQLGFIVVTVGNRGGHPSRSKWYHNYGYGNLRDYGLEDKKVTVEQLAQRHDFIDLDRVGIYGHSGGGFMSTAAMVVYPDFFKVAVSSSGNHTNDVYNRWWSETHHGVEEVEEGDSHPLRVRHRQEPGPGQEPQGPPDAHHRGPGQQRPPCQHRAHGRGADQGEQALRLLRLPGTAARVRRHGRLLVLAPFGILRASPPGRSTGEGRHHAVEPGAAADTVKRFPAIPTTLLSVLALGLAGCGSAGSSGRWPALAP